MMILKKKKNLRTSTEVKGFILIIKQYYLIVWSVKYKTMLSYCLK